MATIAFIPVRGGSKSIPLKNIKNFCGKPLVFWNIKALSDSTKVNRIIVATDSIEIENTVSEFDLPKVEIFNRNDRNASDTASTESVMLEYISKQDLADNDLFMLVQATSPLTQTSHFDRAIDTLISSKSDSLLSCVRHKRFFWTSEGKSKNYDYKNRPRRQDFEGELMENGAFYINKVGNIKKEKNRLSGIISIFEMPEYTAVEIDEEDDWLIAEKLMRKYVLNETNKKTEIKLFLTDVDGVLTDGGMYYSENGDELKRFNTRDGMGVQRLREHGLKTGIITSENTLIVSNRAKKMKVDYLYQGKEYGGKLQATLDICKLENISLNEVAYIGDDINCFELLSSVGMAACPADAIQKIKDINNIIVLTKKGGEGVVREFAEKILGIDEV